MPSDYESGAKKTIDISIKTEKMTADVLKSALQEFLSGKAEKKGRMTFKQLQAKSPSKLDSIEVSDRNIGDFLKTARKYDVDFALKRDKSTSPPTYHVFFSAAKTEDFKRAFSEYVGKGQGKTQKRGEFSREQMQQQAQKLRSKPRKQKQREKTRENRRWSITTSSLHPFHGQGAMIFLRRFLMPIPTERKGLRIADRHQKAQKADHQGCSLCRFLLCGQPDRLCVPNR